MELDTNKAGMTGLDKARINAIISEASRGSKFEDHRARMQQKVAERVREQKRILESLTAAQLAEASAKIEDEVELLEGSRDLSRVIVHLDMDAFYAAVEMRDAPGLRDIPIAVGGMSMLSTSNYAARRFGVRAAMPGFIAMKLCPELTIVPCDFDKYKKISREVETVIQQYDASMHMAGLDEAYFDLTHWLEKLKNQNQNETDTVLRYFYRRTYTGECLCWLPRLKDMESMQGIISGCAKFGGAGENSTCQRLDEGTKIEEPGIIIDTNEPTSRFLTFKNVSFDACTCGISRAVANCKKCGKTVECWRDVTSFGSTAEDVVAEIRFRIQQQTGLTASAGIAPNEMLAKVCSDKNKPNGQFSLGRTRDAVLEFISDLPTRKVPGVGKVTEQLLESMDVKTCGDLFEARGRLNFVFKPATAGFLLRAAMGLGSGGWGFGESDETGRKSISNERTFAPVSDPIELNRICKRICADLFEEIKAKDLKGRNVAIKLKTDSFDTRTRSLTLSTVVNSAADLTAAALRILGGELKKEKLTVRLLGVRLSSFVTDTRQRRLKDFVFLDSAASTSKDSELTDDARCIDRDMVLTPDQVDADLSNDLGGINRNSPVLCSSDDVTDASLADQGQGLSKDEPGVSSCDRVKRKVQGDVDGQKNTRDERPSVQNLERKQKFSIGSGLLPAKSVQPAERLFAKRVKNTSSDSERQSVTDCPVCGRFRTEDQDRMSRHVDDCLTRSAIHETIAEFNELPDCQPPPVKRTKPSKPMDKFVRIEPVTKP